MLNIIMVGAGITIFIYSMTLFWRTYRILEEKKISLLWIILAFLVIFFLLGYVAFEYLMITGEEILSFNTLVSQIFFWGAVFVLICAKLFHSTFIVRKQMEETVLISNKQLQQEIIEHKQAEEKLKYSEKKYRSLVDNSLVGVYQANIKGDFLFVNKALVRMLEFESPEELLAKGCFEIHKNPKDREVLIENLKKIGKVTNFELDLLTKRGKTKHMLLSATLDGDVLSGMIQDITNRKLQEEALEWLRRQNELILNSAGEGIIGLDQEGKHTFVNLSAAKMLGYEVEELIGQESHAILHHTKADGAPYPEEKCPIYAAYRDGVVHHVRDDVFWRKDGTSFPVAYTSTPILEDGKLVGAVVTFWDITERKRSAEMLAKALNEQKNIMDTIPDIIYLLDMSGKLVKWNKKAEIVSGFSSKELMGKYVLDFFPEQDKIAITKSIQEAFEKGFAETEGHLLRKDGTIVPYEWTDVPYKDEQDNVIGLIGVGRDITERKLAEENIKESEKKFKTIFNNATDGILLADIETKKFYLGNEAICQMLGYSLDEIKTLGIEEIHPGKDLPYVMEQFEKQRRREISTAKDIPLKKKDESVIYVDTNSVPITLGERTYMLGVFRDITDRREAEEKLQVEKERFQLAAQSLSDVVYEWDMGGNVQWFGNIDELLGYAPGEFPRTLEAWMDILHPEDQDRVWTAVERHLRGEAAYEIEYRVRHNDGAWRHWLARGSVIRDANGKPYRWVGAVTDITERKQAEKEIRKLNEELEQKVIQRTAQLEAANRELEAFSYSVSHDLKAPLRAIAGFSSILIEDHYDKLDDEGKRLLNIVKDNIQKMGELIEDILALSRIGRKEIDLLEIDMDELAKTVFDEIKATVPEREIQFDIKPLPPANGDEGLIRQVFFNLLFNAIKFTRFRENAVIEVGGYVEDPENVYYVKDNGVGFDMQYADKLFGAFQRLHSDKQFEGTGIGLATVQRIIYRHGGRIWAEGKVNEGATFYFSLPKKEELSLRKEKMFI